MGVKQVAGGRGGGACQIHEHMQIALADFFFLSVCRYFWLVASGTGRLCGRLELLDYYRNQQKTVRI